jgi:2-phospho-L-lactate guanylyltransferase
MADIWGLVPIKLTLQAKQRLAAALPQQIRQRLALTMAEDVLAALAAARGLAGLAVVTVDAEAAALARRHGARVIEDGALDGHTGAVESGARVLAADGAAAVLTMPIDIPCATSEEVAQVIAAAGPAPSFTIAPAHDLLGSNAILLAPPGCVKLRFGEDSFFPHLAAARAAGIEPRIVEAPGIALDIDHPADLEALLLRPPTTRTHALLAELGFRPRATERIA